jgi:hypothetical protein
MTRPPVRLLETELPEELARVLASAGPAAEDHAAVARMRSRLRGSLGAGFEGETSRWTRGRARVIEVLREGKWLGAAAMIGAVGLVFFGVRAISDERLPGSLRSEVGSAVSVHGVEHVHGVVAVHERGHEHDVEHVHGVVPDHERGHDHGDDHVHDHVREISVPPMAAPSVEGVPSESVNDAPVARAPRSNKRVRAPAASSGPSLPAAPSAHSRLADELRGLEDGRALLESAPAQALALAERDEQRFAQGALGPERELLRIEAMLRMGRADAAKLQAARALSTAHSVPYREQLKKLFARAASAAER